MKTTVEIDDDLLKAAKKRAIDDGHTLRQFLELAIRDRLSGASGPGPYGGFTSRGDLYESWEDFRDVLDAALEEGRRQRASTENAS